jgi:murein DD-endopeptidase MepM/ murein hydrolase activator NlpD
VTARKFTILIIPEGSHQVRRFQIHRNLVRGLLGCSLVLLLVVTAVIYDYVQTHFDQVEFSRLKTVNLNQRLELASLTNHLETLQQDLQLLAQNDAKVRVMAQLTPATPDTMTGVGGPPEVASTVEVSELQQKIEQVRQQIDLHRQSQEEIQGFLNDQRSLLAAKPEGWPAKGWMTSGFGMRKSPFTGHRKMHEGVDIAARTGTPVYATADGIVSRAETTPGYGKLVVIEHGYGYKTYYAHNSKILVKVGQRVKRGENISAVGNTGSSTGSHVHYEVRRNGVPLNPRKFL